MRNIILGLFLSTIMIEASILDFMTLDKGEKAYLDSNYTRAIDAYKSLADKNDQAKYNLANSYYKAKKYKEAKATYESIKEPSLAFNKWHNIGNCEANLGHIDAGIKAYEKALKITKDSDTAFNLELLKKKKKEQEEKKQQQKDKKDNKQQKKDQKDQKDKKDKQNKKDSQNKKGDKKDKNSQNKKDQKDENKDKKSEDKNKADKDAKKKQQEQQKKDAKDQKDAKQKQMKQQMQEAKKEKKDMKKQEDKKAQATPMQAVKKEPISDKEVRKYLKMLDKRGVNTLLVPLNTKGAQHEETTPW